MNTYSCRHRETAVSTTLAGNSSDTVRSNTSGCCLTSMNTIGLFLLERLDLSLFLCVNTSKIFFAMFLSFYVILPECDYVTFGYLPSHFRLSSVCNVRACTLQPVEIFCNVSTPFCTLVIRWSCKILRRSSRGRGTPQSGIKSKRGSQI